MHINIITVHCKIIQIIIRENLDWYSILGRFFFSDFSSKSSVNCLNTKDKIFAPMDDDRPCFKIFSLSRIKVYWKSHFFVLYISVYHHILGAESNNIHIKKYEKVFVPYRTEEDRGGGRSEIRGQVPYKVDFMTPS